MLRNYKKEQLFARNPEAHEKFNFYTLKNTKYMKLSERKTGANTEHSANVKYYIVRVSITLRARHTGWGILQLFRKKPTYRWRPTQTVNFSQLSQPKCRIDRQINQPPSIPQRSKQTVDLTFSLVFKREVCILLSTVNSTTISHLTLDSSSPTRYQKDRTSHKQKIRSSRPLISILQATITFSYFLLSSY